LGFLVMAILLVAGLIVLGVQRSSHRIVVLELTLTANRLESFRLAHEFQERLLTLNNAVIRYAAMREPTTWAEFEQASVQLDRWLERYDSRLHQKDSQLATDRERELFRQLNDAYDGYLTASHSIRSNQQPALVTAQGFALLNEFEGQAEHLLQLGLQLADAHRTAEGAFLQAANHALDQFRGLLFVGVAILLFLVAALGTVIYRDQIAPLRTRLVENEVILEKQGKLATLGTLAAGIAHEIRNPLTSIKARLYTLEKHLNDPELARRDAGIISTEISRLESIVQEVLNFARPSEPALKTISANALLDQVRDLLKGGLGNSELQLHCEGSPELYVSADTAHMKQVLINLIKNAAEAIHGKGTILLRARADHLRLHGVMQDVVVLEVADTGRGIPAEIEKQLFDPFFSTKETGTGLGLSIAARIAEKHGGALQYQTRVGHGTTFGIVLPRGKPVMTTGKEA
jgi:signal transduction histidine kinase